MTVEELIARLREFDPKMKVCHHYDDDYHGVYSEEIEGVAVKKAWYTVGYGEPQDGIIVMLIGRHDSFPNSDWPK